jgi:uncharacterized protein YeaO (DUF488 family)
MINVKHFMDAVEKEDGQRIWVEPIGCATQFRDWCEIDHVLSHLGPPAALWTWFEEHPDGWDYFRTKYHEHLLSGPYREALQRLACAAVREPVTLLHQSDDPQHNTAVALHELLTELEAYCPRDAE